MRILPRTLRLFLIAIGCLLGVSAWAAPLDDGLDGELLAEGNALWFSLHSYPGLSDSWQWFDARTGDAVAFGDERPLPVGLAINELEIRLLFRHALTGERLTLVLQRRDDAQAAYGRTALYNLFYQVETADSIGEQGVAFLQEALEVLHRTQPAYTMLWPKDEAERLLASRAVNNKPDDGFRVGMVQESETLRRTGLLWGVTFSLLFLVVLAGSVVSFPMALTRNTWPLSSTRQELVTVWGILLPLGKTLFIVVWGLYGSDIPPQSPVAVGSFWGGDSLSGLPSTWLLAFLHEAFSGLAPVWAHALLRLGIEYLTLLSALFLVSELTRDSRILTGVMLTLIALPLVSPSFGQPAGLLLPCCLGGFLAGFLLYARRLEKRHLLMSLGYGGLLGFVHPLAPLGVLFLIPMLVHVTRDDPGRLPVVVARMAPWGVLLFSLLFATPTLQELWRFSGEGGVLSDFQDIKVEFAAGIGLWGVFTILFMVKAVAASWLLRVSLAFLSFFLLLLSTFQGPTALVSAAAPVTMLVFLSQDRRETELSRPVKVGVVSLWLLVGACSGWGLWAT